MTSRPGYNNIIRLTATPEAHASGAIVTAVTATGAVITALDLVDPGNETVKLDLSCTVRDSDHVR